MSQTKKKQTVHQHFVITNREIVTNPKKKKKYWKVNKDEYLRIDGRETASEQMRFGTYSFSGSNSKGDIQIIPEGDYEDLEKVKDEKKLPSFLFYQELYESMIKAEEGQGEVLVFIHGYNSDLEGSLEVVRKLHKRYVENDQSPINKIVLFTWPARSNLLKYRNDARDAKASGFVLARAILKLGFFFGTHLTKNKNCNQRIHFMVHSMGNQVLQAMMLELNDFEEETLNGFVDEVFLVGADIARDALEKPNPLYDLTDICERVHVMVHQKDQALYISQTTKHPFKRLGNRGIKNSDHTTDNVYEYDITDHKDDLEKGLVAKWGNHWSYYTSSETVNRIVQILQTHKES